MSWTRADVIRQTLSFLGVQEPIEDEDSDKVDRHINPVTASLSSRDKYTFSDIGAAGPTGGTFEDEAVTDLCRCLQYAVATDFGQAENRAMKDEAESNLETIAAPKRVLRVLKIEAGLQAPRRPGTFTGRL